MRLILELQPTKKTLQPMLADGYTRCRQEPAVEKVLPNGTSITITKSKYALTACAHTPSLDWGDARFLLDMIYDDLKHASVP